MPTWPFPFPKNWARIRISKKNNDQYTVLRRKVIFENIFGEFIVTN